MTIIDRTGISRHRSYEVKELVTILHVHEKTVLRWIGNGLPTVDGCRKPLLVMGYDLIQFLKNKDGKPRVKLQRHEFYCMTCKAPRRAKRGSIQVLYDRKVALCSVCNGKMSRTIKPYQKGLFDTPP